MMGTPFSNNSIAIRKVPSPPITIKASRFRFFTDCTTTSDTSSTTSFPLWITLRGSGFPRLAVPNMVPPRVNSPYLCQTKGCNSIGWKNSIKSIPNAKDFTAINIHRCFNHRADHGIQTRGIASTCQNSNTLQDLFSLSLLDQGIWNTNRQPSSTWVCAEVVPITSNSGIPRFEWKRTAIFISQRATIASFSNRCQRTLYICPSRNVYAKNLQPEQTGSPFVQAPSGKISKVLPEKQHYQRLPLHL